MWDLLSHQEFPQIAFGRRIVTSETDFGQGLHLADSRRAASHRLAAQVDSTG
jgi:hypothetical protein